MSKRAAYTTLGVFAVIFLLALGQTLGHPLDAVVTEGLAQISIIVLSGVAVGAILAAIKQNNHE